MKKPNNCRVCGVELNENNWPLGSRRRKVKICKTCKLAQSTKNHDIFIYGAY